MLGKSIDRDKFASQPSRRNSHRNTGARINGTRKAARARRQTPLSSTFELASELNVKAGVRMYKHVFDRVDTSKVNLRPAKYPIAAIINTGRTAPNASDCKGFTYIQDFVCLANYLQLYI